MYALLDCNNFYASCERVFRPDLVGKPVAVLSNNDGCVIARSNEVKKLGIPMGAPAFKYRDIFEKFDVKVFSANFPLYGDMSRRVMNVLKEYCPDVEVYSIDEAFLYFENFGNYNVEDYLTNLHRIVTKYTGIPVSIGYSYSKALSKTANSIAKKYPDRTGGVYVIDTEEKKVKALKWQKIGDVWGIGRRLEVKLKNIGVLTAYDFTQLSEDVVRRMMGVTGVRVHKELRGEPVFELERQERKKSIATTRTFEESYTTFEQLKERVSTFATICSEKLRKEKSCCNTVRVFVKTTKYRKEHERYGNTILVSLPFSTNSSIEISNYAIEGLKKIYRQGYKYKKAGVIVGDIFPQSEVQLKLFENSDPRHTVVMKSIDYLNNFYGGHKVKLATQDTGRVWKMKQEKLSPRYSTNLSDIITVRV